MFGKQRIISQSSERILRMSNRKSGILLHITSLPGKEGIGTLGESAFKFVDFLRETKQKLWQILPLGPVGAGNSPYQCYSAFAGNPMLIDLELLVRDEILTDKDINPVPTFIKKRFDFKKVRKWKINVLKKAFINFRENSFYKFQHAYYRFLDEHAWWLNDYVLFMSANEHFKKSSWYDWEKHFKFRKIEALQKVGKQLAYDVDFHKFLQFLFFRQ